MEEGAPLFACEVLVSAATPPAYDQLVLSPLSLALTTLGRAVPLASLVLDAQPLCGVHVAGLGALVFATAQAKHDFLKCCGTALVDAADPGEQLERGWLHQKHLRGTLAWACLVGDEPALRRLLANDEGSEEPRAYLDDVDVEGNTALHYAVTASPAVALALTLALVEAGASLAVTDSDFATPLHLAAQTSADVVAVLASNGAPLDARNLLEQTPLTVALSRLADEAASGRGGDSDAGARVVDALVQNGTPLGDADAEGLLPLHRAALLHHGEDGERLVRLFARRGANPLARVRVAVRSGGVESLTALHVACGSSFLGDPRAAIPADTPPHFVAVSTVSASLVAALLDIGCAPNACTLSGEPPLALILRGLQESCSGGAPPDELEQRRAELTASASALVLCGGRLDIGACSRLAAELGLRDQLEATAMLFAARVAPSGATVATAPLGGDAAALDFGGAFRAIGVIAKAPPPVMNDAASPLCLSCGAVFSLTRRRHHCRRCGCLVCGHCSTKKLGRSEAVEPDSDEDKPTTSAATAALGFMSALFTVPPVSGGALKQGLGGGERVCDACFNVTAVAAELRAAEKRVWDEERAKSALVARNMAPPATQPEQQAALFGARAQARAGAGGGGASQVQAVMEGNRARLGERGEKLGRLDDKARDMSRDAEGFASAAAKLKRQSAWPW